MASFWKINFQKFANPEAWLSNWVSNKNPNQTNKCNLLQNGNCGGDEALLEFKTIKNKNTESVFKNKNTQKLWVPVIQAIFCRGSRLNVSRGAGFVHGLSFKVFWDQTGFDNSLWESYAISKPS